MQNALKYTERIIKKKEKFYPKNKKLDDFDS